MFCPRCRTEYRAGFTKCADCGSKLVLALASPSPPSESRDTRPHPGDPDVVVLLRSEDPFVVMTVKSILDEGGLPYTVAERGPAENIGYGLKGLGYPGAEPVIICIRRQDERAVRELVPPWIQLEPPSARS